MARNATARRRATRQPTERQRLRTLVSRLPDEQLKAAREHLEYLAAVARIPYDDEPTTPEEDASSKEAWEAYKRGEFKPLEQYERDRGL